jgi:hypothetical protein
MGSTLEVVLVIAGLTLIGLAFAFGLLRRPVGPSPSDILAILQLRGSARCLAIIRMLSKARTQSTPAILALWHQIEMPLLEVLPDCPPAAKNDLRQALEDCSAACADRDAARSIMTMRDALYPAQAAVDGVRDPDGGEGYRLP